MTQNTVIHTPGLHIVVGLGETGASCLRYLLAQGKQVEGVDTRDDPPGFAELKAALHEDYPELSLRAGVLDSDRLSLAEKLYVSPGVSLNEPAIAQALAGGSQLSSDIDEFVAAFPGRIVMITGSNGKSTVTQLLGNMAQRAGNYTLVGGNIGIPVLDLLPDEAANSEAIAVLELSSFQLERCTALNADVAVLLNVSADHMDRYDDIDAYAQTKQLIFTAAKVAVINRHDVHTQAGINAHSKTLSFGMDASTDGFGMIQHHGEDWLAHAGVPLIASKAVRLRGRHNQQNALAALAAGHALGVSVASMLDELREFGGLRHRCEAVAEHDDVHYINDSKGTNVGACIAAIDGFREPDKPNLVLIAGGEGKGADFSELARCIAGAVHTVVLIGHDARIIGKAIGLASEVIYATSLEAAVSTAAAVARSGDTVLFSPACASFDMFANFEARGDAFVAAVSALSQGDSDD